MKIIPAAVLLALPPAASAGGKTVSDRVELVPGREIRITLNNGELRIEPTSSPTLSYQVEFVPSNRGSFVFSASSREIEKSNAAFNEGRGELVVRAANRVSAVATVHVPRGQAVKAHVDNGQLVIAARSGKTKANIDNGTLIYDGAGVSCVKARADNGTVANPRAGDCADPGAVLTVANGTLIVR